MKYLLRTLSLGLLAVCSLGIAQDAALIAADKVQTRIEKNDPQLVVLDVRTPEEFAAGHLPGARNIPHDQLPNRLAELAGVKDKDIVVYCRSGRRSAIAQETLTKQGFKSVQHLDGDMLKWEGDKRPTQK